MRTKYVLIILIICAVCNVKAQDKSYLDTIKISVDNKLFISIATFNYKDLFKDSTIFEDLSMLQTSISKTKSEIPEYKTYKIEYLPGKSLVIKEGENKKSYQVKDGVIEPNINTSECFIKGDDYIMTINFADINDLANTDLKSKVKQTMYEMPVRKRCSGIYNYETKEASIIHHKELDKKTGSLDVLLLNGGMGVGIIKNQTLNDLTATIGVIFPKNGILKYNYYFSIREFITFDNNNNPFESSFLNLGFRVNASNKINNFNWFGLETGYNVRKSSIFGKNALVFGFVKEFGKLSLTSQFYFSDKFSNVYYGMRLGIDW